MMPGFDLAGLRQIAHTAIAIPGFLYQFAETTRDDLQVIAALLAQGDTAAAAARVHRLKGTAGLVGATALFAAARALEETLQAGADPTAALARLRQVHGEALEQIARLPAPPEVVAAPSPGTIPDAARPLVTEIHARLVDGLLPPRALVAALEAALPAPDPALIQTLRYHLDRLDLPAALELLYPVVAGASIPPET